MKMMKYQLQDLRCSKCKFVCNKLLAPHCSCAGTWVNDMPSDDLENLLYVLRRIAEFQNFTMLGEAIENILYHSFHKVEFSTEDIY